MVIVCVILGLHNCTFNTICSSIIIAIVVFTTSVISTTVITLITISGIVRICTTGLWEVPQWDPGAKPS